MGRKSEKNKEKILKRKEEKAQLTKAWASIKKANQIDDPLAEFPVFHKYTKDENVFLLETKKFEAVDADTMDWILDLEKRNMEDMYNNCSWGWSDEKKSDEMKDDRARYLIARTDYGKPVAFSHFRFDLDYGFEVLYCYELQLEESVRRLGLGKFMMQVLELIGFSNRMRKVVLTSLKHNPHAMAFFTALNYTMDETSPDEEYEGPQPYVILSKTNKKMLNFFS
ncbi:unnamed protein product [Bemisia tabaci]|uniref:N-alpha-acetyltransferase 40 n=1 Tax=Bemisia tabaci TaxID=7038 RepID=A0A9P0AIR3_BEMTA|nr:unnamed protein product [Bemisia tabaci]